jgi:hypothetical protein
LALPLEKEGTCLVTIGAVLSIKSHRHPVPRIEKSSFFPYQELREVSKARRNQLSSRSIAAMKAADQSCGILAPSFSGAHRKFTAEEFVSLFLTKPKRECSCGEDKDAAVLAISCVNHAQWRARRAGIETQSRLHQFCPVFLGTAESSQPKSFHRNSERSERGCFGGKDSGECSM